jgi:3-hydroxyacyl-CoA dehydrogenase
MVTTAAVIGAGLIVESGPEDMAFKQALFERMDAIAKPEAILEVLRSRRRKASHS